jgi:hypothetical protein
MLLIFIRNLDVSTRAKGLDQPGNAQPYSSLFWRIIIGICKRTGCHFQRGFYCQKPLVGRVPDFPIQNGGQTFKIAQQVFRGRIRVVGVIYIFSQWAPGASLLNSGLIQPPTTPYSFDSASRHTLKARRWPRKLWIWKFLRSGGTI